MTTQKPMKSSPSDYTEPLADRIKSVIAAATVRLPDTGGQGVLIPGDLILTAAHCIEWSNEGEMVGAMTAGDSDAHIQRVDTSQGTMRLQPFAVEPVGDVAVLGPLDGQRGEKFREDEEKFERFCADTELVRVSSKEAEQFPVHILTHRGSWLQGQAQWCFRVAALCHLAAVRPGQYRRLSSGKDRLITPQQPLNVSFSRTEINKA